jgi:hypothetical protein
VWRKDLYLAEANRQLADASFYWNCKEMRLYGFIKNAVKKGNHSYYTK